MPKRYSAKQIVKVLEKANFIHISQKGSHIKFSKKVNQKTLIVIVRNHKEVAVGTFSSILRQANMTIPEFEKFEKS